MDERQLPKTPIDCVARWGYTFKMVKALVDPWVISFFKTFAAVKIELYMSEATLESLKDIVRIFKPFHAATVKLQSEQLTMVDFYHEWLKCKLFVKKDQQSLSKKLLSHMIKREDDLFNIIACSLLFDPRWNLVLHSTL